ncbi:MAG: DUF1365 domain-containing protein [Fluviibacter sp.]
MKPKTNQDWTKPVICLGEVMHARSQPASNFFRYPLFFLRLPLTQLDKLRVKGLAINRSGYCQILNRDHGLRDGSDLLPWARSILKAHGLQEATDMGEVVLQTMPRIMGYLFNPVSFFFCHDEEGRLRAVISEVSNTFNERHNYLVAHPDHRPIQPDDWISAQKAFHVSPFFPLTGTYHFRFGGTPENPIACINYVIGEESTGIAKSSGLHTQLQGIAENLNARNLGLALLTFPLMTFGVIVRIHWQALKLWRKHVPFFRKPSPPIEETTL